MSNTKKRIYRSESRQAQAVQTKNRILAAARTLFQTDGFEKVTIDQIARMAEVSLPLIYSLFQSKRGLLRTLMDEALPVEEFDALVEKVKKEKTSKGRLMLSAMMARQIYDAERSQMDLFRGAAVLAPEFKALEQEREERRYKRQEETVRTIAKEKSLQKGITIKRARDILWAFTGRDLYRMMVVEQGWRPEDYEKWLAQILIKTLLD